MRRMRKNLKNLRPARSRSAEAQYNKDVDNN